MMVLLGIMNIKYVNDYDDKFSKVLEIIQIQILDICERQSEIT